MYVPFGTADGDLRRVRERVIGAMCSSEQSRQPRMVRVVTMQIEQRTLLAAGWLLVLAVIAMSLKVGSVTGWLVLVALALLPFLMLFRLRQPAQTMSESIREVLK